MAEIRRLMIDGKEYVSFNTAQRYLNCREGALQVYIAQGKLRVATFKKREYIEWKSVQALAAKFQG